VNEPGDLAPETRAYLARSDPAHRKRLGQFFTPAPLREALLEGLDLPEAPRILDPACGTGEFLASAAARWPDAELEGWEVDPSLVPVAHRLAPAARIRRRDALSVAFEPAWDAVVGNPPYFELRLDPDLRRRYAAAIGGRANVYALFVLLGLACLRPGGVLAYVVSTSMTNGAYFRALRDHVLATAAVERLEVVSDTTAFVGAQQGVMLLVLRKGVRDDGRHVFRRGDHVLLAERPDELAALFEDRTTLGGLGWDVRTGTVVWNQRRRDLTHEPAGGTRLIWSRDVGEGGLLDPADDRPRYVRGVEPKVGPAIVVNRVTGSGPRARLRAAVVPRGMRFVGENHVNVGFPPAGTRVEEVRRVAKALTAPGALAAVRRLTGNTQISRTELRDLVPIPE
jgi:adenine-specific DNA-methyltransferase